MIGRRPELARLRSFGNDGEEALVSAFAAVFPPAGHLHCFLHFRENLEDHLRKLHIPPSCASSFLHDILGNPAQLELGLVDAKSEDEVDAIPQRCLESA